jgi:hypothetical protein
VASADELGFSQGAQASKPEGLIRVPTMSILGKRTAIYSINGRQISKEEARERWLIEAKIDCFELRLSNLKKLGRTVVTGKDLGLSVKDSVPNTAKRLSMGKVNILGRKTSIWVLTEERLTKQEALERWLEETKNVETYQAAAVAAGL